MAFRDGPIGAFKLPLSWTATAATGAALLVAFGVLLTNHRQSLGPGGYAPPRSQFDELLEPVSGVLAEPIRWVGDGVDYTRGYFGAVGENRRLKLQVAELQRWKDAAIALKSVNDRYEALLKLRTEPPIPSVAARVTLDARGPFSNARLADAGTERGVKVGDPVLSEHGAVGRVVGVASGASRILLLTDVESRTPVIVDRTGARGILVGDGGAYPHIDYVRGQDPIRPGDVLLTSGDGGGYPRGLPVGVASKDLRGAWRAKLYADRAPIDYVRILSYQDFSAGIDPKSLVSAGAMPALTAEEQKGLEPVVAATPKAAQPTTTQPGPRPAPRAPAADPLQPKSSPASPHALPTAKPADVSTRRPDEGARANPAPTRASPVSRSKAVKAPNAAQGKAALTPKPKLKPKSASAVTPKPTPKPKAPAPPLTDMEGLH